MSFVRLPKPNQTVYVNLDNVLSVIADTREDGAYVVQVTYVGGHVATFYQGDAYGLVLAINNKMEDK